MKKILLVIFLFFFISLIIFFLLFSGQKRNELPLPTTFSAQTQEEIKSITRERLPDLFSIAQAGGEDFGINSQSSLEKSQILTPFPIYGFSSQNKFPDSEAVFLKNLKFNPEGEVPIIWGGDAGVLVHIRETDSGWRETGMGSQGIFIALKSALTNFYYPGKSVSDQELFSRPFYLVYIPYPIKQGAIGMPAPIQLILLPKDKKLMAVKLSLQSPATTFSTSSPRPALELLKEVFSKINQE